MKRSIQLLVGCCVGIAVLLLQPSLSQADEIVSTVNVLRNALDAVALGEQQGRQVLFIQIDHIAKGEVKSIPYPLRLGSEYLVVAVGDHNRILDIDLGVQVVGGPVIGADQSESNVAMVTIPRVSPVVAGRDVIRFDFSVQAYTVARNHNDGFYALIVYRMD